MTKAKRTSVACYPPKPKIEERPLIDSEQAVSLEASFKVLANGTRLRMLHALIREPNLCVGDLAQAIGMKRQAVSNQLQRLVDKGIVVSRRNGIQKHYRIVDQCVVSLIDQGICLTEDLPSGARRSSPELQGERQ